jgi:hypothetical protein
VANAHDASRRQRGPSRGLSCDPATGGWLGVDCLEQLTGRPPAPDRQMEIDQTRIDLARKRLEAIKIIRQGQEQADADAVTLAKRRLDLVCRQARAIGAAGADCP